MRGARLRIFNYQSIAMPPADAATARSYVAPDVFERQCALLARAGLRGVSISAGYAAFRAGDARGLVVLTFDDGPLRNLEQAVPIMRRHGFSGTCYVVSGALGGCHAGNAAAPGVAEPLGAERGLDAWLEAGFEIGSHTASHPHLQELNKDDIRAELAESRATLGRLCGHPIVHFCYPYGDHDERIAALVRRAGYETAVTKHCAIARRGDDPLSLPRIAINGDRGLVKFWLQAATPYATWRR